MPIPILSYHDNDSFRRFLPELDVDGVDQGIRGCVALWRAVIAQCIIDYTRGKTTKGAIEHDRRQAEHFLFNSERDFREVCALAGLDADFVRENIREGIQVRTHKLHSLKKERYNETPRHSWTDTEKRQLERLYLDFKTNQEIGVIMGMSEKAISSQKSVMGLNPEWREAQLRNLSTQQQGESNHGTQEQRSREDAGKGQQGPQPGTVDQVGSSAF